MSDGREAGAAARELLGRADIEVVHVRNVEYGCFNFTVRRAG